MAGRALVVLCLLAGVTAVSSIFGSSATGFARPAEAGVYSNQPVQTSEDPWEQYLPEADVQRAVWALERLSNESDAQKPLPKRQVAQKQQVAQVVPTPRPASVRAAPRARTAARLVVPKPGSTNSGSANAGSAKRDSRPRIAVVIDDLGLNGKRTQRMIELDGPLTLAFLPYGYNLSQYARSAASQGHEVFLHLPMEPFGNENPGPNALLENLGPAEFERRMLWAFEQVEGIKGFNNHMGSRLTSNPLAMQRVMTEARKRNLLFLDSRTSGRSVAYDAAMAHGVPAEIRDIFLDHDPSAENVATQLKKTETVARRKGHAIAIGHPYDTTYSVLKRWVGDARDRGFELVPVSVLIEDSNAPRVAAAGGPAPSGGGGVRSSVQRDSE